VFSSCRTSWGRLALLQGVGRAGVPVLPPKPDFSMTSRMISLSFFIGILGLGLQRLLSSCAARSGGQLVSEPHDTLLRQSFPTVLRSAYRSHQRSGGCRTSRAHQVRSAATSIARSSLFHHETQRFSLGPPIRPQLAPFLTPTRVIGTRHTATGAARFLAEAPELLQARCQIPHWQPLPRK
jgi:hypothetical protein